MPVSSSRHRLTMAATLTGLVAAPLSVVALAVPASAADPVTVTVVGTNDFHGRLLPDRGIPGAAKYAGALNQLRAANPDTVFAAAGDLIGATTFESFIADDKPTIDVLNEMGLEVSAVGNHELDKGYDDLVHRVLAPESEANPTGGAAWAYLAANLGEPGDQDLIEESWVKDFGTVQIGFVGAVTEHLDELVSPDGIVGVTTEDIVAATNREAATLVADGADAVVLLVHEGAKSNACADIETDSTSDFGRIVAGVDDSVDAIVSGHTHLAYSCTVDGRPVVSAGQYGSHLDKLDFTLDPTSGDLLGVTHELIDVNKGTFTADPEVQAIVEQAQADAETPGSVKLGTLGHGLKRAVKADGSENRGGESTLGNLVAEVQRWATASQTFGGAQIAFMNPGGLREDMLGLAESGYPADLTYRQAANVQPYANTLVNMQLTGSQIRSVLEEQWQPEGASRPFLRLGVSRGFEYTYDPTAEAGKRIQQMWLRGERVRGAQTYSVTANSFLASGGDNFGTFAEGSGVKDTGQTDLEAMVDFMARYDDEALSSTWDQHAMGVRYTEGRKGVRKGTKLKLNVSSWSFSAPGDIQDTRILVTLGKLKLGRFDVDNTPAAMDDALSAFDEVGTAKVRARIPAKQVKVGRAFVKLIGNKTGNTVKVPVIVKKRRR